MRILLENKFVDVTISIILVSTGVHQRLSKQYCFNIFKQNENTAPSQPSIELDRTLIHYSYWNRLYTIVITFSNKRKIVIILYLVTH